jgi:RNA polymerase sigma-70 factor (ECF subfamily)
MTSERARRRFLEVFAPYLDDAYSLAKWLAGNATDAEDIVQDSAIRALTALERAEIVRPKAWTLSIVRNVALTYLAHKRPGALAFVGDVDDLEALDFTFDDEQNPEEALIADQTGARVREAIAALPSPLKETLILREVNELDYKEIAEATGAPLGTVMSRLARARAALARALKDLK